jgi:hypothetical protein
MPFETPVIPAKAGIQSVDSAIPKVCQVDSRFRGNDCSRPGGLVQSGSAIVGAWIPAFAGMSTACNAYVPQMTPVPDTRSL